MTRRLPARADPWHALRSLTPARIALGRAGSSLPTHEVLDFALAHARARDAVHAPFDASAVAQSLGSLGLPVLQTATAAGNRTDYLHRPDWGRRLDDASRAELARHGGSYHVCLIVSDGLSAWAAERHALPLLEVLVPALRSADLCLAPLVVVRHGRVAVEDEIGQLLGARVAVILLGERPGLAAPDSLGAYLVFDPRPGRTDAERNCVSNIRPRGLPPEAAAWVLQRLILLSLASQTSGLALGEKPAALP
mgnify:CR=1 FL=1